MKINLLFVINRILFYVMILFMAAATAYTVNYFTIDFTNYIARYPHFPEAIAILEGLFFGTAVFGLANAMFGRQS